ncbi:MAG: glycosyltransferase family 4 protein [Ardenticatenaceae bacterium]
MSQVVLYVNPTAVHGGAEEVLLHIMSAARELGYQPVLVVPKMGWLTEQCEAKNIPVELLPSLPDAITNDNWKQQLRPWLPNAYAMARLVRKWRAVLVHSNTPRASYHGGLGARLARVAAVTHVHDMISLPYRSALKGRLLSALADRTLTVSSAVEQMVGSFLPQLRPRLQTLYNGWDVSLYAKVTACDLKLAFGIPQDCFVIGNVSVMSAMKGQDVLIEAFRQLYRHAPQTRLLIVGGSQGNERQAKYEAKLHQQVAEYGLQEAVVFAGWREDAWEIIKSLDLFVHTPTDFDSLPTVLLHASALGRAIVASQIGGIPEIVLADVSGLIVPPRDVNSLHHALATLINDPLRRLQLGQQAHLHFKRRFSRQQLIEGLSVAYQKCLTR